MFKHFKIRHRIILILIWVALGGFGLIGINGCSSAHSHKVLSFFFDGVPEPANDKAASLADSLLTRDTTLAASVKTPVKPMGYYHSPYQDKQCASCHDQGSMGKLKAPMPGVCNQCHEDYADKYANLHGPVAGGQCTQCHNPHMSANENLLIRTNNDLCLQCHDAELVMQNNVHKGNPDALCLTCHDPHGGANKNNLR